MPCSGRRGRGWTRDGGGIGHPGGSERSTGRRSPDRPDPTAAADRAHQHGLSGRHGIDAPGTVNDEPEVTMTGLPSFSVMSTRTWVPWPAERLLRLVPP